jgi:CBS domain-containing protein
LDQSAWAIAVLAIRIGAETRETTVATVDDILGRKGRTVRTIEPTATIFEAIGQMVKHNVGALVVVSDEGPCGILTERDYLRRIALEGRRSNTTFVHEIMSSSLITVRPDTSVDDCMNTMTDRRIQHLPVTDRGKLVGIVSIGDAVKQTVHDQQREIQNLIDYVQGGGGAMYAS